MGLIKIWHLNLSKDPLKMIYNIDISFILYSLISALAFSVYIVCSYDLTQRMMMAGGKDCQRKSSRMRSHAGTNVDTSSSEVRSL